MSDAAIDAVNDAPVQRREAGKAAKPHPFVGSRPFEKADSAFYFGRDREASQLANLVAVSSVTVLYGESGVGKSSLLNTRLEDGLTAIEPDWMLIPFNEWQPGSATKLAAAVSRRLELREPSSPGDIAKTLVSYAARAHVRIVLIFDQFEEFFLYQSDEFTALETELAKIVNRRDGHVCVLLSLRSDGLFLLDRLRLRIPHIFSAMFRLEPLTARAAVETIRGPIGAYNAATGAQIEPPAADSEIVKALVQGSQRKAIIRRLSNRGRGEAATSIGAEVVLPFLQLALDALWERYIVEKQRQRLDIKDLREFAGLAGPNSDADAVGLIVQKHVDRILNAYDPMKQRACASMFERMVLPSGQKVTVQLKDVLPHLDESEKRFAKELLEELSDDSHARLVKRVAPPPGENEISYQIIHDAMAVPILDWVDRFNRAARIRSETRKVAIRALLFGTSVLVAASVLGIVFVSARGERAGKVGQMLNFAELSPISGFRLPLLLSLSALDQASGEWWWALDKQRASDVLVSRLVHAPRFGGTFVAVGFDPRGERVAWLDAAGKLHLCGLAAVAACDPEARTLPPLPPNALDAKSRNADMLKMTSTVVGFVDGVEDPIILSNGVIHYLAGGHWEAVDTADVMSGSELSGFVGFAVGGGAIRISSADWQHTQESVFTLRFAAGATPPFVKDASLLKLNWIDSKNLVPVLSASGEHAAAAYVEGDGRGLAPCQNLAEIDPGSKLPQRALALNIWSARTGARRTDPLCSTPLPQVRAGIGFSGDEKWLGMLYLRDQRPRIQVFSAAEPGAPAYDAPVQTLGAGGSEGGGGGATADGPPFTFGTLALSPLEGQARWRFAWQTSTGVRVEPRALPEADPRWGRGRNASLYQYGAALQSQSPLRAWNLGFSVSGNFLAMESRDGGNKQWTIMVWDLRDEWVKTIGRIVGDGGEALRQFACRTASFDPSSEGGPPSFKEPELDAWDPTYAKPCGA